MATADDLLAQALNGIQTTNLNTNPWYIGGQALNKVAAPAATNNLDAMLLPLIKGLAGGLETSYGQNEAQTKTASDLDPFINAMKTPIPALDLSNLNGGNIIQSLAAQDQGKQARNAAIMEALQGNKITAPLAATYGLITQQQDATGTDALMKALLPATLKDVATTGKANTADEFKAQKLLQSDQIFKEAAESHVLLDKIKAFQQDAMNNPQSQSTLEDAVARIASPLSARISQGALNLVHQTSMPFPQNIIGSVRAMFGGGRYDADQIQNFVNSLEAQTAATDKAAAERALQLAQTTNNDTQKNIYLNWYQKLSNGQAPAELTGTVAAGTIPTTGGLTTGAPSMAQGSDGKSYKIIYDASGNAIGKQSL